MSGSVFLALMISLPIGALILGRFLSIRRTGWYGLGALAMIAVFGYDLLAIGSPLGWTDRNGFMDCAGCDWNSLGEAILFLALVMPAGGWRSPSVWRGGGARAMNRSPTPGSEAFPVVAVFAEAR